MPVQEVIVPDPALDGVPPDEVEVIGQRVIYRLAQHPGPYAVLKYVLQVAKRKSPRTQESSIPEQAPEFQVDGCPSPQGPDTVLEEAAGGAQETAEEVCPPAADQAEAAPEVSSPPVPPAVIARSSADVSFLAGMIVDKFKYHLPLYRQHQRLEASGIFLERSTLTRLIHRCGELLEPVYHAILSSVLLSKVLAVDESPTPAGRDQGKMHNGYYWAIYGDQDEVAFLYSPTRSGKVLDEVLGGFEGVLLSDGYVAYESFVKRRPKVTAAQCWTHTRRNFVDSERVEPEKSKFVIDLLRPLWELEAVARASPTMTPGELRRLRQEVSRPIVDQFFDYIKLELAQTALLPSNPFVQACEYAIARENGLRVFLDDPAVPLDTNHVERALRPQAVGRKNWMFHVTEVGARYGAIFYTLIQSCVISGVNVTEYLVDVLQRIDTHPAAEVHLLAPRLWGENFAANPMRSDLARR